MIVGVDFGTTNSLVAYVGPKCKLEIIPNERGSRLTPSVVYFKNEKQVLVGELARSQMLARPEQTILKVKRKMGTGHRYKVFGRDYTPSEIGGLILRKLKNYASDFLGKEVKQAVITVPAYFDDNQRQGVLHAARLAGIEVVKLLNEPTAAALAYGVHTKNEKTVLVLDFGGGTFDITLMKHSEGLFEVITTGGSTELGGSDFDEVLARWVVETVRETNGVDLATDPIALQQVYNHVERAKIDLSSVEETNIVIPYIAMSPNGPIHINLNLSRSQFEHLTKELLKRTEELILTTLEESQTGAEDVDVVVLAGGTSRMPAFRSIVCSLLPKAEIKSEINPDEVVALGAAIQAAVLEGKIRNIELKDVLPHSLGVLDDDGEFVPIIERDSTYPTSAAKIFTNAYDDQDYVEIRILQKRRGTLVDLGNFRFTSKKKWKKNEANIAVTFQINQNGVLEVSAEDLDTNEVAEVTITGGVFGGGNQNDGEMLERRGTNLEVI